MFVYLSFFLFLSPPGICEVDNTPKGWFIKLIDKSPATLAKLAVSVGSLY